MTGPDHVAPPDFAPPVGPPPAWPVLVGLGVGAVAVLAEWLVWADEPGPRGAAAVAAGIGAGLAGWLAADLIADRSRRRTAAAEVAADPPVGWAARSDSIDATRPLPAGWAAAAHRRLWWRSAAAGAAAVAGAVVALARMTPERVAVANALTLGYPAVVGAVVAVAEAFVAVRAAAGWAAVHEAWQKLVTRPTPPDLLDLPEWKGAGEVPGMSPEPARPAARPGDWSPTLPPPAAND